TFESPAQNYRDRFPFNQLRVTGGSNRSVPESCGTGQPLLRSSSDPIDLDPAIALRVHARTRVGSDNTKWMLSPDRRNGTPMPWIGSKAFAFTEVSIRTNAPDAAGVFGLYREGSPRWMFFGEGQSL